MNVSIEIGNPLLGPQSIPSPILKDNYISKLYKERDRDQKEERWKDRRRKCKVLEKKLSPYHFDFVPAVCFSYSVYYYWASNTISLRKYDLKGGGGKPCPLLMCRRGGQSLKIRLMRGYMHHLHTVFIWWKMNLSNTSWKLEEGKWLNVSCWKQKKWTKIKIASYR